MDNLEKIKKSTNMVEISQIILSGVFYEYCKLFGENYRKFNRNKETQEDWTSSVIETYGDDIKTTRKELFKLIPNRFHKTIMYNKLREKLHI